MTAPAHSPEHVIITGGSQQLLYMTLEALCDEGDIILVEDPTYFVFLSILQSQGVRARGVKLERDGIDLAHLEKVLERLKNPVNSAASRPFTSSAISKSRPA